MADGLTRRRNSDDGIFTTPASTTTTYKLANPYQSKEFIVDSVKTVPGINIIGREWIMWDTVTHAYHLRKAKGHELPINPLVVHEHTRSSESPTFTYVNSFVNFDFSWRMYKGYKHVSVYSYPPPNAKVALPDELLEIISKARASTHTGAYAKMNGSTASTLVSVAEFKKTSNLIVDSALSFAKVVSGLQGLGKPKNWGKHGVKRVSKRFINLFDSLGDVWMGVRFGIRPTLYDIEDHQKAMDQIIKKLSIKDKASVYLEGSHTFEEIHPIGPLFGDSIGSNLRFKTIYTVDWKVVSSVRWRANKSILTTARKTFGITNLGSLLWEVTPLSWCFDYVFNIGQTIMAHETSNFIDVLPGYQTLAYSIKAKRVVDYARSPYSTSTRQFSPGISTGDIVGTAEYKFFERTVIGGPSIWPRLDVDLDWKKCTDLAIVSKNLIKGVAKHR